MRPISRRTFLKLGAAGLGLAACQRLGIPLPPPAATSPLPPESPTLPSARATPPAQLPAETLPPGTAASASPAPARLLALDAHEDLAWNALEYGRDPLQSAFSSRAAEEHSGLAAAIGERATGLAEWQAGSVALVFATLYVAPARRDPMGGRATNIYYTPAEAATHARSQIAYYRDLVQRSEGRLRLVTSLSDLNAVLDSWGSAGSTDAGQVGLVLLMEGAEGIEDPSGLAEWHAAGLRLLGPAWAATRYAGAAGEPGPLTDLGRSLLEEMAKLNMPLDLSHLSEQAALQALDAYPGPVMASHSVPRGFIGTERGLTDEQIRKLADHDGVMGILPVNYVLQPGWKPTNPPLPLSKVVEAIDTVAQLTGSARHAGLGSDFDGGFGPNYLPMGMASVASLIQLAPELERLGYSREDIQAVFSGNFLRILRRGLV